MPPLQPSEVLIDAGSVAVQDTVAALDTLWLRGGFPQSYSRSVPKLSMQWRTDFIQTYLERDIPQLGVQVAGEQLSQFWRMLANDQGELFNAQRYAKSMGISGHTIARYPGD